MAIKQFKDYAQVKGYGNMQVLPKGAYIVQIKGVCVKDNKFGQYLEIDVDIAEGDHKNHFMRDYESQSGEDRRWRGKHFVNVPNDDGSEKDGWAKRRFKTFVEALEESNPGYHFDWEESNMKGLYFGALYNEREYRKKDGSIGRAINLAQVITAEKVRSGEYTIPADKLMAKTGETSDESWMNVSDDASELPF